MSDCTDDCDLADICSQRHWSIYGLIIVGSCIFVVGRLLTLGIPMASGDSTPFMSANDRSRWATVRSLGDQGTYVIDDAIRSTANGIHWDTIDKIKHLDADGQLRSFSSKPTLFPTLVSGVYCCIKSITGLEISEHTLLVVRMILLVVNAVPWLLFLWLLGKTLERIQLRDWSRYFVVAVAGYGTFLSTFVVTLNNHLPAAVAVMAAIYGLVLLINIGKGDCQIHFLIGTASAFAAATELPALSFLCLAAAICCWQSPRNFLIGFLPGVAIISAGFFITNYLAHDDWRPPYAHKGDGPLIEIIEEAGLENALDNGSLPEKVSHALRNHNLVAPKVSLADWNFNPEPGLKRWIVSDLQHHRFTIIGRNQESTFEIRAWDNWYDYENSYWTSQYKSNVDLGQSDTALYLFHVMFGHHGIFSLTPIWLFSLAGILVILISDRVRLRWLAAMSLLLSVVVLTFYVFFVPDHDRNYGGHTSAFRWALWLAPFWLICMAPIVDWMGKSKRGRALCLLLLFLSSVSALYSANNPWIHPWLYEVWDYTGLPK